MNKPVTLLSFLTLSGALHAQRFFVELHGSWQQPIGGYSSFSSTGNQGGSTERESETFNFGKGAGAGLVVGGLLGSRTGWEARVTRLLGAKNSATTSYVSEFGTDKDEISLTCESWRIEAAMRFHLGAVGGWYMAIGPSVAVGTRLRQENESNDTHYPPFGTPTTSISEQTVLYTGRLAWGAFGAVGYTHQGKGRMGWFAEMNCTAQSWAPMRSEVTKYTIDGIDYLDNLDTSERETEYVESYTTSNDPNEARKAVLMHLPMSSFGLRAGIRIALMN